jgi:general secretion pathway protein B
MSFILDALKKLEHKQKRGSVPHVLAVQEPPGEQPKKRKVWLYIIISVLFLNAVVIALWMLTARQPEVLPDQDYLKVAGHTGKSKDQQHPDEDMKSLSSPVPEERSPGNSLRSDLNMLNTVPGDKQLNFFPEVIPILTAESQEENTQPEPPSPEVTTLIADTPQGTYEPPGIIPPTSEEPPADEAVTSDTEVTILNLQALPEDIRKDIPKIVITGHIYSNNPLARIVNINGHIVREGENAAENLRVEEITPTGVIFNFQGLRFALRAF